MDNVTIRVTTMPCVMCGEASVVEVDRAEWKAYTEGALVQDAFPSMHVDERELLVTGTHPKCWDDMTEDL